MKIIKQFIFLIILLLLIPSLVWGATYWAHPSGTATAKASCAGTTDPGGNGSDLSKYCQLTYSYYALGRNINTLSPGDTVKVMPGTYDGGPSGPVFQPAQSGSAGAYITVEAADYGNMPVLTTSGAFSAIWIEGRSYYKFKYFNITSMFIGGDGSCNGSHHIEIAYNTFASTAGYLLNVKSQCGDQGVYTAPFSHLWIHDNTFYHTPATIDGCGEEPKEDMNFAPADPTGVNPPNTYITVENNTLSKSGHALMDWYYTIYSVIRNNKFHNPPWIPHTNYSGCAFQPVYTNEGGFDYTVYNGLYSHRAIQLSDNYSAIDGTYNLVEDNRFGHAARNPGNGGWNGIELSAPKNIIRYNFLYNNMANGLYTKAVPRPPLSGTNYNAIYNNTFYHNGWGGIWPEQMSHRDITLLGGNNYIKNNLMYGSRSAYDISVIWGEPGSDPAGHDEFANNWCKGWASTCDGVLTGDPKFKNPDISQPYNFTLPDLTLEATSGAINKGAYLTTATNSGANSTTLTVANAMYFQDGTWGADMVRAAGTMNADYIAIGTVTNIVQISSATPINYATGEIKLASSMNWSSGASVWLYKKSDGTQVLYGTAPDLGAYEYTGEVPPSSGSTSWGAIASATELTKRTFLQDWTCYLSGGTPNGTNCISLSGDAEKVSLNTGDYAQMTNCVYTGSKGVRLEHNKYASTPNVTMKYRTSTSQALCEAAGWSIYTIPFQSQGYIGIRVEK